MENSGRDFIKKAIATSAADSPAGILPGFSAKGHARVGTHGLIWMH